MAALAAAGQSEKGPVRKSNDDAFRIYPPAGEPYDRGHLLAVADGIGSYRAGGQAAQMAVDQLALYFRYPDDQFQGPPTLEQLIYRANDAITSLRTGQQQYYGMGTTLTVLLADRDAARAIVYQVGDSMAYLWRRGRFSPLNTRQSGKGSELANHLGIGEKLSLERTRLVLQPDDRLLLCTDGLCGALAEEQLGELLGRGTAPEEALANLMQAALPVSQDNITAIVAIVR